MDSLREHLRERFADFPPSPTQPRADGADRYPQRIGDSRVVQFVVGPEEKDGTGFLGDLAEHPFQELEEIGMIQRPRRVVAKTSLGAAEASSPLVLATPTTRPRQMETPEGHRVEEPSLRILGTPSQRPEGQQRLLDRVIREGVIAKDAPRHSHHQPEDGVDEGGQIVSRIGLLRDRFASITILEVVGAE